MWVAERRSSARNVFPLVATDFSFFHVRNLDPTCMSFRLMEKQTYRFLDEVVNLWSSLFKNFSI